MRKLSIGIDIGSDGGYAVITNGILQYGTIKDLTMGELKDIILDCIPHSEDENDLIDIHVVLEDLHSIFGTSAKSNFQFGVNNGKIIGMLEAIELPFTLIAPKKWQREMWQGVRPIEIPTGKKNKKGEPKYKIDTKSTSLLAAKRLFPKESFLATERSKVPHNGIVDSVLLAEFCRRNF